MRRRRRVITWHVHGAYLYYLAHTGLEIYVPVGHPAADDGALGTSYSWPATVHEIPARELTSIDADAVIFQSRRNWDIDQHELLSELQRTGPRIYVEHDPPREHPTDTRHFVDDPSVVVVHVTPYNALMWDTGRSAVRVVDHGVTVPDEARHTGALERGIVVVNGLSWRGRRLGRDIFESLREHVPLDLAGIDSEDLGGLGPVVPKEVPSFVARYRFFFHPARYTSLGLAVIEAMLVGTPVVGLATTELVTVIENGRSGYVTTDPARLLEPMRRLLDDPGHARAIGEAGRRTALARFDIDRFARDWRAVVEDAIALAG